MIKTSQVHEYISESKLRECVDYIRTDVMADKALLELQKKEIYEDLALLSGKLALVERNAMLGVIGYEENDRFRLRIAQALLLVVQKVKSFTNHEGSHTEQTGNPRFETINRDDGAKIIIGQALPVASDSTTQISLAIGTNGEDKFVTVVIRFKSVAQNISNHLSIRLEDDNLITIRFVNAHLAYIGESQVAEAVFLLTDTEIDKLKNAEIKTITIKLSDGLLRTYQAKMNADILKNQLNVIAESIQKKVSTVSKEDVEITSKVLSLIPNKSETSTKILINLQPPNPKITSEDVRIAVEILVEYNLANYEKPPNKHDKIWLTSMGRQVKNLPNGFSEFYYASEHN